jgi:hypothetical protein
MATEHSRFGEFRVMSEQEDNCPNNLSDQFNGYSALFFIGVILTLVYLFIYCITSSVINVNPLIQIPIAIGITCTCGGAAIICQVIRILLPYGFGVKIYVVEGESSTTHYSEWYYQYTGDNGADAQKIADYIRVLSNLAQRLNREKLTMGNKNQERDTRYQDVMAQVNERLGEH